MTGVTGSWRIGTRASTLARAQAESVAAAMRAQSGCRVELVEISTSGDRSDAPLVAIGGTGVFATALRDALRTGAVDLAVHSYKDLPTTVDAGLEIVAVPPRADPRDALVARDGLTLGELPVASTVGTGSPRRAAQLRLLGLGLDVVDIRGNVDTRLRAVADGVVDAVVLARAGLARIGRLDAVTETLDPLQMLPAPAQGALAVEVSAAASPELRATLGALDDLPSRITVEAERAVLATLEAGCSAPIGALAVLADGEDGLEMYLRAIVADIDGLTALRRSATGPVQDGVGLGRRLASELLADGAADIAPSLSDRVTRQASR